MIPNNEYWIEVNEDGRLVLPGEVAEHCLPQACGDFRLLALNLVRRLQLVGGERGRLLRECLPDLQRMFVGAGGNPGPVEMTADTIQGAKYA